MSVWVALCVPSVATECHQIVSPEMSVPGVTSEPPTVTSECHQIEMSVPVDLCVPTAGSAAPSFHLFQQEPGQGWIPDQSHAFHPKQSSTHRILPTLNSGAELQLTCSYMDTFSLNNAFLSYFYIPQLSNHLVAHYNEILTS